LLISVAESAENIKDKFQLEKEKSTETTQSQSFMGKIKEGFQDISNRIGKLFL